jgi:hypothetical protein
MLAIVLAGLMVAGCVSLSSRYATRPPQGRSASEISQDEAQCEEYAKHQVKHQGDHYRVCMVSGFYAANVDMDEVSWTIGVTQPGRTSLPS